MVKRCIAAGCSNTGIPLLERAGLGKHEGRLRIESGPTATSHLCSDHFTKDCFVETSRMAAKF